MILVLFQQSVSVSLDEVVQGAESSNLQIELSEDLRYLGKALTAAHVLVEE